MRGTCAHPNDVTETKPRPPQGAAEVIVTGFPHALDVRLALSTVSLPLLVLVVVVSELCCLALDQLQSLVQPLLPDTLTDSSDPPALASREARFEVLRRVSLAVAISDFSPQESKESSTESSHHKKEVREHRQPGPHSTNAIPVSTEYTTLYTRPTTVKC